MVLVRNSTHLLLMGVKEWFREHIPYGRAQQRSNFCGRIMREISGELDFDSSWKRCPSNYRKQCEGKYITVMMES